MSTAGGEHQRRLASAIAGIYVGARIEQNSQGFSMPARRCESQWRVAILVFDFEVGTRGQKLADTLALAAPGCVEYRGLAIAQGDVARR